MPAAKAPKVTSFSLTPRALQMSSTFSPSSSARTARVCSWCLTVLADSNENLPLLPAAKVPMWMSFSEMPRAAFRLSTASASMSKCVPMCCRAALTGWFAGSEYLLFAPTTNIPKCVAVVSEAVPIVCCRTSACAASDCVAASSDPAAREYAVPL